MNRAIKFVNNKDETLYLDESVTITDLLAMGCRGIKMEEPYSELEDNWWRAKPEGD